MKKIKKKLGKLLQEAYDIGWDEGWDAGYEANNSDEDNWDAGVAANKKNVQTRLKMLEEGYMLEGKGTKAVMVREIAELLAFEFKPEDSDASSD